MKKTIAGGTAGVGSLYALLNASWDWWLDHTWQIVLALIIWNVLLTFGYWALIRKHQP
jgi:hypothetical protein